MKNTLFSRPLAIPFVDRACLVSDSRFLDSKSERGRREKRWKGTFAHPLVNLLGMYIKEKKRIGWNDETSRHFAVKREKGYSVRKN